MTSDVRPKSLSLLAKSDIGISFIIAFTWQAIITVIGTLLTPDSPSVLSHMTRWDGGWYLTIINDQYKTVPASPAFYPLFPFLVSLLSAITFDIVAYPVIALVLNTFCLGMGLAALLSISRHFIPSGSRLVILFFFLAAPSAFFMHLFYGEALFVAIGFWAYAAALRQRWLLMGALLGLLTAARLPSLLFIGLCGLEYMRANQWDIKQIISPRLAYFLLAPVGFICYGIYLLYVRSNFLAMFSAYEETSDWVYQSFNPDIISTIGRGFYQTSRAILGKREFDHDIIVNHAIPLLCITLLFASSIYLLVRVRGKGIPLGIFGLVSIVFFTINNNLVSVHRYTLPCLTIYITLMILFVQNRKKRLVAIVISLVMLAAQVLLILMYFITRDFVG